MAAGRRIGVVGRCIQWLLGDWIAYGNAKFGERYARASQITGYDPQTLMNMVYVATRFAISRRRENLSWSHHETLAALDQGEQDRWLDEAAAHRWSVADLRMMLRSSRKAMVKDAGKDAEPVTYQRNTSRSERNPTSWLEQPLSASLSTSTTAAGPSLPLPPHVKCPSCGEEIPLFDGGSA
ncbi:MAG TPA: hypothetical protein VGY13_02750 [Solirubrobacteraceae bacterium]|nr:hypothetical protein [Solirubrobacteraceae bacterium]